MQNFVIYHYQKNGQNFNNIVHDSNHHTAKSDDTKDHHHQDEKIKKNLKYQYADILYRKLTYGLKDLFLYKQLDDEYWWINYGIKTSFSELPLTITSYNATLKFGYLSNFKAFIEQHTNSYDIADDEIINNLMNTFDGYKQYYQLYKHDVTGNDLLDSLFQQIKTKEEAQVDHDDDQIRPA